MSNSRAGIFNDAGKPFTSEKNGSFAPSRADLAQSTPFRRGTTAETSVWIKLTEPGGKLIHINLGHVTSVRSATVIPGARAQLELTSGKFQGVQEDVEQIMELTGGEGVDAAVEAFGFPQTFEACLRVTKAGGRVSNIGYHGENPAPLQLPLDAFGLGMNDKSIHTGLCPGGNERMNRLFRLMLSGRIDPTPMTTHTFGFDDVSTAFAMMTTKDDGIIKPLITFA